METKYITIPFDVERAKRISNGEEEGKIVTRDGKEVRIICFDLKNDKYPIIGLVKEGDKEAPETFKKNGIYTPDEKECEYDLFLSVPEWTTFKDGDIVGFGDSLVGIFKSIDTARNTFSSYATLFEEELIFYETRWTLRNAHKANEKEVERIKSSLKTSKDPRSKEYLKRFFGIEETPNHSNPEKTGKECELKPFDKVLVRDYYGSKWRANFFSHMTGEESLPFSCGGLEWRYCIPYEGNEHLLGTSNDPE